MRRERRLRRRASSAPRTTSSGTTTRAPGSTRSAPARCCGEADVVVVRFGEKYKQWNAAFDAGQAAALGKPLITLHPPEHDHALKEVDRAALAIAREPEQVVSILRYAIEGRL